MALSKKGWRTISVNNVSYRWTIKFVSPQIRLIVKSSDGNGQCLTIWFDQNRVITPRIVEFAINTSLTTGWHPLQSGPDMIVAGDELVRDTEFKVSHPPGFNDTHF